MMPLCLASFLGGPYTGQGRRRRRLLWRRAPGPRALSLSHTHCRSLPPMRATPLHPPLRAKGGKWWGQRPAFGAWPLPIFQGTLRSAPSTLRLCATPTARIAKCHPFVCPWVGPWSPAHSTLGRHHAAIAPDRLPGPRPSGLTPGGRRAGRDRPWAPRPVLCTLYSCQRLQRNPTRAAGPGARARPGRARPWLDPNHKARAWSRGARLLERGRAPASCGAACASQQPTAGCNTARQAAPPSPSRPGPPARLRGVDEKSRPQARPRGRSPPSLAPGAG
jgi:hypothetical protein